MPQLEFPGSYAIASLGWKSRKYADATGYSSLQSDEVQAMWRDPRLLGEVGDLCTSLTRKAL